MMSRPEAIVLSPSHVRPAPELLVRASTMSRLMSRKYVIAWIATVVGVHFLAFGGCS